MFRKRNRISRNKLKGHHRNCSANLVGGRAHGPPFISVLSKVIKALYVPGCTASATPIYKYQKLSTSDFT